MDTERLKLKDELDSIINSFNADDIITRIDAMSNNHFQILDQDCGRVVPIFSYAYNLVVNLLYEFNFSEPNNLEKYKLKYLLLHSNLKSIFSSFNCVVRGFYTDSTILIRPVYESFILIIFVTCFPECAEYIYYDDQYIKKHFKGKKTFNLTQFIKSDLNLDWKTYAILSTTSHINRLEMVYEFQKFHIPSKKQPIHLAINYDRDQFSLGLNYINHMLYVYLKMIRYFFLTEPTKRISKEKLNETDHFISLFRKMLLNQTENFWGQVTKDTDDIFEMMIYAEDFPDWKSKWLEIRLGHWFNHFATLKFN
jgi:hypothetical protein